MSHLEPIHLEPAGQLALTSDRRPRIVEPPPVKLVSVNDVRVEAPAGLERELDAFYVGILQFEREPEGCDETPLICYRAENFRLRIGVIDRRVDRDGLRPIMVEVPALSEIESLLKDAEVDFVHQRGLLPGKESLLLRDPAGNWVEVVEVRLF